MVVVDNEIHVAARDEQVGFENASLLGNDDRDEEDLLGEEIQDKISSSIVVGAVSEDEDAEVKMMTNTMSVLRDDEIDAPPSKGDVTSPDFAKAIEERKPRNVVEIEKLKGKKINENFMSAV